jgi:hypothetical protein
MTVRRLTSNGDVLTRRLTSWLRPYADRNLINPSVHVEGDTVHVVFRSYGEGVPSKPLNAYYTQYSPALESSSTAEFTDLTAFADSHDVGPVADPKLFAFDGRVFVTFNTGLRDKYGARHVANSIYVMQVAPTLRAPQCCVLEPRHAIEKNWGFYEQDGELRSLYSMWPVVRLQLVQGDPGGEGDLHLSRLPQDGSTDVHFRGDRYLLVATRHLTVGTQPLVTDRGLVFIGHEKVFVRKYCGYAGRIMHVTEEDGKASVRVHPDRLIHSLRDARPRRGAHNPNALFVTYFSGLTLRDDRYLIGYGINDVDYGFAQLSKSYVEGDV